MSDYRTFLVPYDFSAHSKMALDTAVDLAHRLGARLHLVHVVQTPAFANGYGTFGIAEATAPFDIGEIRQRAMGALGEVIDGLPKAAGKVEAHVVEGGHIAEAIGAIADRIGADLIVMGTHGHTGLVHAFLGSVAERTLRHAPCPVLTVRAPEDGAKK
jgi:nucleotide-binding universal stress UspA family protein